MGKLKEMFAEYDRDIDSATEKDCLNVFVRYVRDNLYELSKNLYAEKSFSFRICHI